MFYNMEYRILSTEWKLTYLRSWVDVLTCPGAYFGLFMMIITVGTVMWLKAPCYCRPVENCIVQCESGSSVLHPVCCRASGAWGDGESERSEIRAPVF